VTGDASSGAIDVHAHFFPREWPSLAERFGTPDWPWMRHDSPGRATVMLGEREFRAVDARCWDADVRLEAMDRDGIALQVMSATPVLFSYGREAGEALEAARIFNDAALDIAADAHGRIVTFCQVPLQDVEAACRELDRCLANGHLGVEIGNHVGDTYLDDPGILEFLQHCAEVGAPVFVHPWDMRPPVAMQGMMMPWLVGMPAETHLSILRLILTGAFDRLPASLRICFAHGGGSFAFWLGRLANAWRQVEAARGHCEHPPEHYVSRFTVDSAVFDQRSLRLLVDVMGEQRVLLGSDHPFPMGEERVGSLVRGSDLDENVKDQVLHRNARRFLGLGNA